MNSMAAGVQAWVNAALGFFFPEACQICGNERGTAADGFVGPQCWSQVRFIKPPFCQRCGLPFDGAITTSFECSNCREMKLHFRSARSAVAAKGPVLDAIHRYKYERALWFEPFLAGLLIRQAEPELRREKWDRIVPVPLHPAKKREREFNQAERIAARLGRATGIPVDRRLLKTHRRNPNANVADSRRTRRERPQRVRHGAGGKVNRPASRPSRRCFYYRRDDQRLREGAVGRGSRGCLCVDRGAGIVGEA
jgi:predicted amidophosphoribosyltransferase